MFLSRVCSTPLALGNTRERQPRCGAGQDKHRSIEGDILVQGSRKKERAAHAIPRSSRQRLQTGIGSVPRLQNRGFFFWGRGGPNSNRRHPARVFEMDRVHLQHVQVPKRRLSRNSFSIAVAQAVFVSGKSSAGGGKRTEVARRVMSTIQRLRGIFRHSASRRILRHPISYRLACARYKKSIIFKCIFSLPRSDHASNTPLLETK